MDELQISGKRFISSRRIAKDNGYHTDYIGQLIRGNKIKGQKVGRAWYVDAASFDAYLGGEATAPVQSTAAGYSDFVATKSPEVVSPSLAKTPAPFIAPTPAAPVVLPEPAPVVVQTVVAEEKKVEEKVEIKKEEPKVVSAHYVPVASGGLRFVADDEPLLPEIENKVKISRMPEPEKEVFETKDPVVQNSILAYRPRATRLVFALAGLAVFIFVFSAVVSSAVFQKINIEAGNPASVGYGIEW